MAIATWTYITGLARNSPPSGMILALSVLVAKGRAQVGVAASSGDWSKRIRDMQYTDHEDYTVGS